MLTPHEHARADIFELWLKADRDQHDAQQLGLFEDRSGRSVPLCNTASTRTLSGRKEWPSGATTPPAMSTPTVDRSSYA